MILSESNNLDRLLRSYAVKYNDPQYFVEDPIAFPTEMNRRRLLGEADNRDVEIASVIAAHLAWGRRCMIVRDCGRAFDEMGWRPYDYVMRGRYKSEQTSLHRTVMWSEFAQICSRLKQLYERMDSLEHLSPDEFRVSVFGRKSDLKAANKKIHMMRRWLVRRDGKVDLGLWKNSDPGKLVIPLDTHVHSQAVELGLTVRNSTDYKTALEITEYFRYLFPGDPCLGDFALFGKGVSKE